MSNDVVGLQRQIENVSSRLDVALHKLADYQRVVAGAVKGGVYENDNHWWHELCRLANEQAVEHVNAADDATRTPKTELTITDDRIYSTEATGATPRRR